MSPNVIFVEDEQGEGVCPMGVKKREKGSLKGDQEGMINGKWMRGRRREGKWEEREEKRRERRGGQKSGASMLLHIHYSC